MMWTDAEQGVFAAMRGDFFAFFHGYPHFIAAFAAIVVFCIIFSAGDIVEACLRYSRYYQPHEADRKDSAYDPEAEKCVFAGDVVIQARDEISLDEATAEAIEMLIGAVESAYIDDGGLPPELERAVNALTAILENR